MKTSRFKKTLNSLMLACLLLGFSACESGFQKIASSEYAVVFSALPRFLGGGVKETVLMPGEMEFVFPWETLYRMDTGVQSISWGAIGRGDNKEVEDYVETRALDGNEVGLAIVIQYHINPDMVRDVVQYVASTEQGVRRLVEAASRADIRTHMNILKTRDFFDPTVRHEAVDQVKKALNLRLQPEGIIVDAVIYNDHRFERHLAGGKIDRTYQEQIDRTQALNQETQQEIKKIATVIEGKKQEFNEAQARVNRQLEETEGYKRQAMLRGDAYLKAKQKKAEQVTAVGLAEVEALKAEIAALSGPGGEALLKLSLVEQLVAANPRFVLMNSSSGDSAGFDFNRVDTNELIKQMGMFVGAADEAKSVPRAERAATQLAPKSTENQLKSLVGKQAPLKAKK